VILRGPSLAAATMAGVGNLLLTANASSVMTFG